MPDRLNELTDYCRLIRDITINDRNKYAGLYKLLCGYIDTNRDVLKELLLLKRIHSYTESHSLHVALYSLMLALCMGLSSQETQDLVVGSLLHDVGKIIVGTAILDKPTKLNAEEFLVIKRHPQYGIAITGSVEGMNSNIISVIQEHHEKLDGTGYPNGIKKISFVAQIAAIADIFDAVTSQRSYHDAISAEQAIGILQLDSKQGKLNKQIITVLKDSLSSDISREIIY